MNKGSLLLAFNFREPIGSPNSALENNYNTLYLPFLTSLEKHKEIRAALHFSGVLYDWFNSAKPEFFDKIKLLIKRGQVEILTGGHYDPILPLIPDPDKIGQIVCQTDYIKKNLGFIPRGMWIGEGSFEPHLVKHIHDAGVEYMIADHSSFGEGEFSGYYVTEEEGHTLKVFPSTGSLNEVASFEPSGSMDTIVLAENAEKYDGVASIEELFNKLSELKDKFSMMTFSEYADSHPGSGRVYLKAGSDRDILLNDIGANYLHKKMLYVSNKIETVKRAHIIGMQDEGRANILKDATRELWKGEGPSSFFDKGLEARTRMVLYSRLIEAENLIDSLSRRSGNYAELSVTDFDKDGESEALIATQLLNVYVSPNDGGAVFELDYKPKMRNLIASPSFYDNLSSGPCKFLPVRDPNEVSVRLSGESDISGTQIKIAKTISVFAGQSIVNVYYELENGGDGSASFPFEVRFDLAVTEEGGKPEVFTGNNIKIIDGENGFSVSLDLSNEADIVKRCGRSTEVSLTWKVYIKSKDKWTNKVSLLIEQ